MLVDLEQIQAVSLLQSTCYILLDAERLTFHFKLFIHTFSVHVCVDLSMYT